MPPNPVRVLTTTIARRLSDAYAFAHQPENFPKWASGLSDSLHRDGDRWIASTPQGQAEVVFSPPNAFGVLDHWVRFEGKPEIYIPLRMIADGEGVLVELVLFRQAEMDDAAFERDAAHVEKDLAALKALLEG